MSELHDMLHGFESGAAAEARDRVLDEVSQRRVRATIARKRHLRVAVTSVAAVAASVAIGTGAWAAIQYGDDAPIATTTPSPTASATPTPSTSPTPSPEPVLTMPDFSGEVAVDTHLPSALPITPEAWNAAGPGWVLATYQEQMYVWDDATQRSIETYGPQVAYLISPEGDRYQLTQLPDNVQYYIAAWDPRASVALVVVRNPDVPSSPASWNVLDLTSGELRAVGAADVASASWTSSDMERMWGVGEWDMSNAIDVPNLPAGPANATPSADLDAARATAQSLVADGETCQGALALDNGASVIVCGTEDLNGAGPDSRSFSPRHYAFVDASGEASLVAVSDGQQTDPYAQVETEFPLTAFHGGVLATTSSVSIYACTHGLSYVSPTGVAPLAGVEALKATDDSGLNVFHAAGTTGASTYSVVTGGCSGNSMPDALVRDNVATGDYSVLIPFPSWWLDALGSGELYAGDQPWPTQSIISAYVVPDWKDGAA